MSLEGRASAAELGERRKAGALLAAMDRCAELAAEWEQESVPLLRQSFALRYRRAVGVHPAQRDELRAALQRVRDGGRMPVAEILHALRDQLNASSPS